MPLTVTGASWTSASAGHRRASRYASADRVPARDAALGTRTYYYGNYLYRRTTPIDLIVPGLPGLVIADDPAERPE